MAIPHRLTRDACAEHLKQLLFPNVTGSSGNLPEGIGIELEQFTFRKDNGEAYQQVPVHGKNSLSEILAARCASMQAQIAYHEGPNSKDIKYIAFPDGSRILFEPGGQVEISTPPCTSAMVLDEKIRTIQQMLTSIMAGHGIYFGQRGVNSVLSANMVRNQLNLPRYRALEAYLDGIGPYGRQMMMRTCSLHINIDAGHADEIRMKRLALANLLAPIATAVFANSPFRDATGINYNSYRSVIWRNTDPLRTGILPFHLYIPDMDKDAMINVYLNFALDAPLIYIRDLGDRVFPTDFTMRYWMDHPIDGISPQLGHWDNHLSLLFPEVRLKGYLEIRTVDAPPIQWQLAPIVFYAGILFSATQTDKALALLMPYADRIEALHAAAALGLRDETISKLASSLVEMAITGTSDPAFSWELQGFSQILSAFYEEFTVKRLTFADFDAYIYG